MHGNAPDGRSLDGRSPDGIVPGDILMVWCGFVFLFFSASGSKLPSYILPMFPALALLLVMRLRTAAPRVLRRHLWLPALLWVAALAVSTQLPRLVSHSVSRDAVAPIATALQIGAVVFVAGCALAWWCLGRGKVGVAVLSVALAHLIGIQMVLDAFGPFSDDKSAESIAKVVRPMIPTDTPLFAVQTYDQTLPFYFGRDVVLVEYFDEFALGQHQEPERSIPSIAAFVPRWNSLPRAAAYMRKSTYEALARDGLPMKAVFDDGRRVMVLKP